MTMAILSLLATLIPFGIWLYKRHAEKEASPMEQHRNKYEAIEKPVAASDDGLAFDLDELDRLLISKRPLGESGPGGSADGQGPSVHSRN